MDHCEQFNLNVGTILIRHLAGTMADIAQGPGAVRQCIDRALAQIESATRGSWSHWSLNCADGSVAFLAPDSRKALVLCVDGRVFRGAWDFLPGALVHVSTRSLETKTVDAPNLDHGAQVHRSIARTA